jgi:hypothetical protein
VRQFPTVLLGILAGFFLLLGLLSDGWGLILFSVIGSVAVVLTRLSYLRLLA